MRREQRRIVCEADTIVPWYTPSSEVLIEVAGIAEHTVQIRGIADIPSPNVLVEFEGIVEHEIETLNVDHIPTPHGAIE